MMARMFPKSIATLIAVISASNAALFGQSPAPSPSLSFVQSKYEKQFPIGRLWPVDLRSAEIEIDNSLVSIFDDYFKDWNPTLEEVRKILSSYFVISKQDWLHTRSHVAGNDRGGWLTLEDGTKLKWMLRPGGLGFVLYPDGGAVYLDACCPEEKQ